jgi:hypothetical protein
MLKNQTQCQKPLFTRWSYLFLLTVVTALQTVTVHAQTTFEVKTDLQASALLSPDLLKSDLYTIDGVVHNNGLVNQYTVQSIYGNYEVNSTLALKQLLHEIRATAAMKKIKTEDTAGQAVVQSGKNTVNAVTNLVTEPKETLSGAASGIGSLFNRATETIGKRKTTTAEDNKLEQFIGKSKSKGQIANKFGVNVYSRNPALQEELDRLAWADYVGGIGVGVATAAIPGVGGLVISTSGTARLLNDVINTTPASELWVRNKKKLLAMHVNPDTAELYLNNPSFSPALQTVMVEALESMKGVVNRELLITVALQANNPELARTITEITTMTAGYNKNISPLHSLSPMGRVVCATAKNGSVVVVFPADHVLYTEKIADIATWMVETKKEKGKTKGFQLWILGDFSKVAQSELQAMGWELHSAAQDQIFPETKKPEMKKK